MDQNPRQPGQLPQPQEPAPNLNQVANSEIEPPTTPVPPSAFDTLSTPAEFQPIQLQPVRPKSHRTLWIVIASVCVVLIGGAAAAYQFWYQNPEKVVADSVLHALQAKTTMYTGTTSFTSGEGSIKLTVNGVYDTGAQNLNADITVALQDQEFQIKGSALIDRNSDLYIKLSDLDSVVESYLSDYPEVVQEGVDRIVARVNGQWLKINPTELAAYDQPVSRSQTCWSNAVQQTENHASFLEEISASYKKNKYITISEQLGQKEGSFGYVLSTDNEKLGTFIRDLKDTQAYKTLHECDPSMTLDVANVENVTHGVTARSEIWVSMFSHEITKVSSQVSREGTAASLELTPISNQPVTVTAPDKSITLKDLQEDLEAVIKALKQVQAQQPSSGSGQSINDDPLTS